MEEDYGGMGGSRIMTIRDGRICLVRVLIESGRVKSISDDDAMGIVMKRTSISGTTMTWGGGGGGDDDEKGGK